METGILPVGVGRTGRESEAPYLAGQVVDDERTRRLL